MAQSGFETLASPSSPPSVSMLQPISMVPEHKDLGEVHGGGNYTHSSIQKQQQQQQQQHLQPPQDQQQQDHTPDRTQAMQRFPPSFHHRAGGDVSDEATETAIMEEPAEVADDEEPRCSTPASSPYPYPNHHNHQRHNSTSGRSRSSDPGASTTAAAPPPPPPPPHAVVSSDDDDHNTLLQSWSGECVFPVPAVIYGNSDSSSTGSRRRSLPSMLPKGMTLKNLGIKIASPLRGALNGGGNNNGNNNNAVDPTSNNRSPGDSFKGGRGGGGGGGASGQNINTSQHSRTSGAASSSPRRRATPGVPRNAVSVSSFSHNTDFSPHVLLTWSLEKAHDGPIWAAKFSPGGRYLATAGEDGKILVWAVGSSRGGKGGAGGGAGSGSGSGGGGGSGSGAREGAPSSTAAGGGGDGRRSSTNAVAAAPGGGSKEKALNAAARARAKKGSQRRVMKELNGQQSAFTQGGDGPAIGTEVKLLSSEPIQRFQEHTGDVIDLSWSPGPESNFLLSASLDKTVRLWHVSKPHSLQVFPHDDLVTAVDFHPVDDEYFVSGGLDKKLRLWSTTKRSVRAWAQAPEAVTAARFAPAPPGGEGVGGQTLATVVAGLIKGQVYFYKCSTPKGGAGGGGAPGGGGSSGASVASGATSLGAAAPTLRYHTQILCRNRQGTHSEGRKVTGLSFRTISPGGITAAQLRERSYSDDAEDVSSGHQLPMDQMSAPCTVSSPPRVVRVGSNTSPPGAGNAATMSKRAHQQLLVTTNDSRLRVIGLDDYCVIHKYKGAANTTMQIKASYSESGNNIISGSEVGNVHVWDSSQDQYLGGTKIANHKNYDRSSTCASFVASTSKLAHLKPVVTCAVFAPTRSVEASLIGSNLFPTLDSFDHINHDISSSMMVSCDYEGTVRVFLKKSTLDVLFYEAGPEGSKFRDVMR